MPARARLGSSSRRTTPAEVFHGGSRANERPALETITISIRGEVTSWKRPRANHETGTFFTAQAVETWHGVVRQEASRVMGPHPPISKKFGLLLEGVLVYLPPSSWSQKRKDLALAGYEHKVTRPDIDNGALKGLMDALRSIVYEDDAQIIGVGPLWKIYGPIPRLEIRLSVVNRGPLALPEKPAFHQLPLFAASPAEGGTRSEDGTQTI